MPSIIPCPSCSEQVRVPDELFGKWVKCPRCGQEFAAPASNIPQAIVTPPPLPSDPSSSVPKQSADFDPEVEDDRPWEDSRLRHGRMDAEPHRGTLILVLGIVSVVSFGGALCWGLGSLIGLPLGIAAWVMGHKDLQKIRSNQMDREGEGLTLAGRVLGIVGTVLGGLGLLFLLACGAFYGFMFTFARNATPPPAVPVQVAPPAPPTPKKVGVPPATKKKTAELPP
jgi:hypothetical protein